MNELNPVIKAIAEYYQFEIEWCHILNLWRIRHETASCGFFWRSDCEQSNKRFFDDLKIYFGEIGAENYAQY